MTDPLRHPSRAEHDHGRDLVGSPAAITIIGAGLVVGLLAFPAFRFAAQTIVAASELLHEVQQLRIEGE